MTRQTLDKPTPPTPPDLAAVPPGDGSDARWTRQPDPFADSPVTDRRLRTLYPWLAWTAVAGLVAMSAWHLAIATLHANNSAETLDRP